MIPFDAALSSSARADLLILIQVIFWIYVPVSFICVASYAAKQARAGELIDGKNAPLPFAISAPIGWGFIVCVLGFIFLQSPIYVILVLAGIAGLLIENGRTAEQQFGLARLNLIRVLSWSLLVFGAVMLVEAPLVEIVTWFLKVVHLPNQEQETVETFRHIDQPSEIFQFIFVAAFLSPIIEELFFRGYLIGFLKKYTSTWAALVLSAGIFAFAHPLNLGAVLPLWFLGVVLGVAYEHTGSLLLPIGIHACWNLVTALSVLRDKGNPS
jgi:membrane protease YdiL (CAAX protease family)